MSSKKILIFGGSFDPVHTGHVEIVKHFAQLLQVDEVCLIPAGQPWQKKGLIANAEQRITMLNLAFQHALSCPYVIDAQEVERAKTKIPSYAIETLTQLRQQHGQNAHFYWLMGMDQWLNLPTWRSWENLFSLTNFLVAARPGYESVNEVYPHTRLQDIAQQQQCDQNQIQSQTQGKVYFDTSMDWAISATEIRHDLADGRIGTQTQAKIPPEVLDYIQKNRLYQF